MQTALLGFQVVLSVLLIAAILLQSQGTGLGSTWSGGGETYHTRRGLEKLVFYFTIIGVAVFACIALAIIALA